MASVIRPEINAIRFPKVSANDVKFCERKMVCTYYPEENVIKGDFNLLG